MLPTRILELLAFAPPPPPPGTKVNPTAQLLQQIVPFLLMGIVIYFLLIRGPRQRARQQEEMLKGIKSGDKVETASGIVGVVIGVKDTTLSIRSADSKFEILKSAVTKISERAGESSPST